MSLDNIMETTIDSITPDAPIVGNFSAVPNEQEQALNNLKQSIVEDEDKTLNDYNYAKIYLNQLISDWKSEEQRTEANRLTRDVEINVDTLRETGDIDDDECFIPERIIDSNIQREMPSYINFLKNSRRIAIFQDQLDPTFDTDRVEQDFTRGMTYKGWTKPHFKVIDSSMTHGWASVEVVYDERYPLHCGIEYIAHEDLLFAIDAQDIQASSVILRRYRLTSLQLKNWVAQFGFDLQQVNFLIEKYKEERNKDKTIEVFKRYCKHQGVVYCSWFSIDGAATDWLKKPIQYYIGIDKQVTTMQMIPKPMTGVDPLTGKLTVNMIPIPTPATDWIEQELKNYPIFIFPYRETEKPLLFDYKGRVFFDKDKQEAQTAIITAFVNRVNRSQKVYASPSTDQQQDGRPAKQLANFQWKDGTIFDKPMTFWTPPPPEYEILKAMEYMDTSNSQDIGQTDFATLNREDSRKTAREVTAAQQAQTLLDSVDLTLFSEFIREVYSFAWLIVRSQALQNRIKFLLIENPVISQHQQQQGQLSQISNGGSIVNTLGSFQQETSPMYINDNDTISRQFDIRAAGDVDVVQKQELVQQMMQDWPVIQQTPLASRFLADLIKLKYPQDGAVYTNILMQGNVKNSIIQSLGAVIIGMLKLPEVQQHLTPQDKQGLAQVQKEAEQALQIP